MTIRRAADTIANSPILPERVFPILPEQVFPILPERVFPILPERGHLALDLIRRHSIEGANLRFVMPSLPQVRPRSK